MQHEPIPIDSAGYAVVQDEPAVDDILKRSENHKRWVALDEDKGNRGVKWPDNTIRYCFETAVGRAILGLYVREAIRLWDLAGLRHDRYRFHEVDAVGSECKKQENLVIRYRAGAAGLFILGDMSAYLGKMTGEDEDGAQYQSEMDVSFQPSLSSPGTAGGIAHEFGHVWGLTHEFQNPGFWSRPYGPWPGRARTSPARTLATSTYSLLHLMPLYCPRDTTESNLGIMWDAKQYQTPKQTNCKGRGRCLLSLHRCQYRKKVRVWCQ